MMIRIRHETHYRYAHPVKGAIQYLRLTPDSGPSQNVVAWKVSLPGQLTAWRDQYGNHCHSARLTDGLQEISVVAEGTVETRDTGGILPVPPDAPPAALYLRQTAYSQPDQRVRIFAEGHRAALDSDCLEGLHGLMLAIGKAVAYDEDQSEVETTAAEALAAGHGVCQDHAHLFVACCRCLGVPARYVSGYLAAPGGGSGLHAASHAWAEALVPGVGWVSFDAANGISADEHYLRLAVGLDYADAGPLRGVRQGGGDEVLRVQVQVQGQG